MGPNLAHILKAEKQRTIKIEVGQKWSILKEEKTNITNIVVSNFFMLLFGYLGEKNIINKKFSIPLGFVFFANTFNLIHNYAIKSVTGKKIFNIILPIWGMYGIAACLNDTYKNNMFNILDIFSKNFFSLFIYYKLQDISKSAAKPS